MKPSQSRDYPRLSDPDLADLLHRGDRRAFDAIFDRYWKRLYAYAFRVHGREGACEDSVQDVFVGLWERRGEARIDQLEGYLFRAVKYRIANHLRNVKFDVVQEEALDAVAVKCTIEDKLALDDLHRFLTGRIAELSPRCRRVFELSRFGQRSNPEIAARLDISVRTVEKHLSDALRELRGKVEAYHLLVVVTLMFS